MQSFRVAGRARPLLAILFRTKSISCNTIHTEQPKAFLLQRDVLKNNKYAIFLSIRVPNRLKPFFSGVGISLAVLPIFMQVAKVRMAIGTRLARG